LRRREVPGFREDRFGDDLPRAVAARFRPRDADLRDGDSVAGAFFLSRSACIFAWCFVAAALVSQAFSRRLPSASVHRA